MSTSTAPYVERINEPYSCYCSPDLNCNCAQIKQKVKEAQALLNVYTDRRFLLIQETQRHLDQLRNSVRLSKKAKHRAWKLLTGTLSLSPPP